LSEVSRLQQQKLSTSLSMTEGETEMEFKMRVQRFEQRQTRSQQLGA